MSLIEELSQTKFYTILDNESLNSIQKGLSDGSIKFISTNTDRYFQILAKYPYQINRLDWSRIRHISLHPPPNCRDVVCHRRIGYGVQQKEFILSLGQYFAIHRDRGYLFDDLYADCVLEIIFDDLAVFSEEFLYTPGHKYFLGSDNQWLLNITMEGDIYFTNDIVSVMT